MFVRLFAILMAMVCPLSLRGVAQEAQKSILSDEGPDSALRLNGASTELQAVSKLIESGRLVEARTQLSTLLETMPASYQTHLLEAHIYFSEKRFQESLNALQRSFALEKSDSRIFLLAGLNWVVLNRLDLARPFLEQAVNLAPENEIMHYHLGRYYYTAQLFSLAEREFREVVRLQPLSVKGFDNLGLTLQALDKGEEAVSSYRRAMELAEQERLRTEWPFLNLAKLFLEKGDYEQSLMLVRQAAAMNPKSAEVLYVEGKVLERLGKEEEALRVLLRSVEIDSDYPESHYLAGRIYLKQGRKKEAQSQMEIFQALKQKEPKKAGGMGR